MYVFLYNEHKINFFIILDDFKKIQLSLFDENTSNIDKKENLQDCNQKSYDLKTKDNLICANLITEENSALENLKERQCFFILLK